MAMDVLPLYASFHYRNSESVGGSLSLKLSRHSLVACRRRTPSSTVCAFSGQDKSREGQGQQGQGQHTHSSALSNKKPFRLRGRLRLAVRRLRRLSPCLVLRALIAYARAHSKQVALSTLFGCTFAMACLCLKLTSIPAPHFVPYSELVSYIQSGSVTSVLFEEGSRQVFFNIKSTDDEPGSVQPATLAELAVPKDKSLQDENSNNNLHIHTEVSQDTSELATINEDVTNQLQTEMSALKAVMEEDMVKQWVVQESVHPTFPGSSFLDLLKAGKALDFYMKDSSSSEGKSSIAVERQVPDFASRTSLETFTDNNVAKQESSARRASPPSAAAAAFSSTLKAIGGGPDQLRKTQSQVCNTAD